jgi:sodium-dependent dicarboxylate transporter 2/3/5
MSIPPELPPGPEEPAAGAVSDRRAIVGLIGGAAVFAVLLLLPAPDGMSGPAWRVAAVALLMAVWWVTEAIPVPATAMIPLVAFPLLGVSPIKVAAAPYANPLIFLFMGGFMIALAMERWELHRRIALYVLKVAGNRQDRLIAGFMVATAGLSMWISNTATTVMMLPIALSVIRLVVPETPAPGGFRRSTGEPFPVALLLGVAYAASIGGLGTLIGTPPNAFLAGFMAETYRVEIGFAQWMMAGIPLSAVMLVITWVLLTRFIYPVTGKRVGEAAAVIDAELTGLGPLTRGEKTVALVFFATGAAWILRPLVAKSLPGVFLHDAVIAMTSALALFCIPVDAHRGVFALNWEWARRLPWGVLVLFGGGLSLAGAIARSGLAGWIGEALSAFGGWPVIALVAVVVVVIIFLTELTSNTATAAAFLPVVAALAVSVGENPFVLVVPAALAASCAFMLPVATPPNAIVFGSRMVTIPEMVRAGIWLNICGIIVITAFAYTLLIAVFSVEPGVVPDWAVNAKGG